MNESRVQQAALGLGDTNVDPDILTREIDHDFFDDPVGLSAGGAAYMEGFAAATCQDKGARDKEVKILNSMPKEEEPGPRGATWEPDGGRSSSCNGSRGFMRLADTKDETGPEDYYRHNYEKLDEDSGRSSANITVHLEVGKEGDKGNLGASGGGGTVAEDFYSMQSNANYPRPKESYKLQQRRRSFGSIQNPHKNSYNPSAYVKANQQEQFEPMNPTDCGLNGNFGDVTSSSDSSSNSGGGAAGDVEDDESDSDLSDSSESELESLDTDDEEFVDMLEKYFDYIEPDSECSDLTEVSPLSSLAPSPLPPSFFGIGGVGEVAEQGTSQTCPMNITSDAELCSAAAGLQIGGDQEVAEGDSEGGEMEGAGCIMGLSATAIAAVTAVASAVPAAAQLLERDLLRSAGGKAKPRLPMVISTMETVIIPAGRGGVNEDESDEDNNAPRSMISGEATCGTSIDVEDTDGEEIYYEPTGELHPETGDFGEPDPAKDKKELDVCFNCCVLEHAKKILSREASPSRKHKGWLLDHIKQEVAEGSGNLGHGKPRNKDKVRVPSTWNGKLRVGSSTSATSSSSSTATGSSSSTTNSQKSGGAASCCMKKSQKNYTFTPEQMRKIERENHILLRKILDTHQKRYHHGNHCHHHRCKNNGHQHHQSRTATTATTSITRLRQQKRIDHENTILMKKLQSVKPSKEIGDAFGKPGK